MEDQHNITLSDLKLIRKNGWSIIFKTYLEEDDGIPILWLFFDSNTSSFILVNRTYETVYKSKRHFNHIIIPDSILDEEEQTVSTIFKNAIAEAKKGICSTWVNHEFLKENCERTHS